MYSQNSEEQIILNYFKDYKGTLLDIGANDGMTLSNSLALIERGWQAILVEPSPSAFVRLLNLHKDNTNVLCYNFAIGEQNSKIIFYDSGTHLGKGDTSLLSTASIDDKIKWQKTTQFNEIEVDCRKFENAMGHYNRFDFITIDAEGLDLVILEQIDLEKYQTKLVCVEYNGKDEYEFDTYLNSFGLKFIHKNAENLIYGK